VTAARWTHHDTELFRDEAERRAFSAAQAEGLATARHNSYTPAPSRAAHLLRCLAGWALTAAGVYFWLYWAAGHVG
jgi:hypothetical protein